MGDKDQESEVEEADEEAKVDKAPPTVVPGDEDTTSGRRHRKWLVAVIVAVVVVVVAGLAGWRVVENRRHGSALESCNRAAKSLQERTSSAKMARYREASGVKADQVKDAKTVTNMSRSVKAAGGLRPSLIQCNASMSTGELNTAVSKAKKLDSEYEAVSKAVKVVLASRDAKTLDDAKAALNAKKDEASKLLGDSDGKVADNATRDNLQTAINQAGQVKGDEAKAYQDATGSLQAAIDRVNASMQKSQADQQAAAQAQAQAAQQQAQRQGATQRRQASSSNGRRGSTQSRRPASRPSGNQGGGSAPQNQGNDKSWEDEWNDFIHRPDNTMHGCNPDGSCGIG
ncbi:hypothetical protein H3U87_01370 [Bifidobacterium sp. W8101]|uniref:hypothetical protein n=1 Tax=Bifidobacterium TaxID=1678 RepID=UPI0018DCD8F3|nr:MULTISPECIES: hypothetical protein [Bifidobacterium]MBI0125799.1 hypothetical protein [Bifidobacterium choladohabitans]MBI0127368.1 hypothetical protein [Bifidobacterium sp. W8103]MBI0137956.1 hypothetical protein [Bifidobacterium sp. W8105]MBI0149073.1 hypothetical protein [Bifidobacterium sp. W8107]